MKIDKCSFADLETDPGWEGLLAEYADEGSIRGAPRPKCQPEMYRHLEALGLVHIYRARVGTRLVGFVILLTTVLPHYGVLFGVTESFFVAKAHRITGAGVKLLCMAEARAEEMKCIGLLVSAPYEGKLFELLPRLGYVEASRVFFRPLGGLDA